MKTLLILLLITSCKVVKPQEEGTTYATKCYSANGFSERYFLVVESDVITLKHNRYETHNCNGTMLLDQVISKFNNLTYSHIESKLASKNLDNYYLLCGIQELSEILTVLIVTCLGNL